MRRAMQVSRVVRSLWAGKVISPVFASVRHLGLTPCPGSLSQQLRSPSTNSYQLSPFRCIIRDRRQIADLQKEGICYSEHLHKDKIASVIIFTIKAMFSKDLFLV
ncbi:uncharacterized protein LOC118538567 [Halichoerus grypus]